MSINAIIKIIIVLSMFYDMAYQYCPQPHVPDALENSCDDGASEAGGGGGGGNGNQGGGGGGGDNGDSQGGQKKGQEEEDYHACGQYGFRCIDLKTFEICPGPPLEDDYAVKEEPVEHVCGDGLICDEDNPAYCTPMEASMTTPRPEKKEEPLNNWVDENAYFDDYMEKVQKLSDYNEEYNLRVVRSSEEDSYKKKEECPCSTPETTEMTTVMTTTVMSEADVPMTGPFECEGYGFHADTGNNTLFWYCDVPESGTGYLIKHMSCGEDRVFDPSLNTCVKIGTTRNIRNGVDDGNIVEHRCAPPTPPPQAPPFSCKNFPPGKYKDDNDCSLYHICFSNKYFPVKELTLSCPHNMAFDAFMKKCTHKNGKRCSKPTACPLPTPCPKPTTTKCPKSTTTCTKKSTCTTCKTTTTPTTPKCRTTKESCTADPPCSDIGGTSINCKSPIRFRDVSDCSGYFLCYADNVIHMNCPESFKFDDSYHDCMPNRIARCTEEI